MLRRLYDRTMQLAGHRHAGWGLAGISFIESSVFPIPPDALLIPMVLARRERAWLYAAICTLASVAGGVFGYLIGLFFFEEIGRPLLDVYGYAGKYGEFQAGYAEWGSWIVFGAGLTPFPYKVITIASGVFTLDFATFIVASVLSRGLRFFLVAGLLWWFGPPIRRFLEANLALLTTLFFVLLLGGFLVIRYLW